MYTDYGPSDFVDFYETHISDKFFDKWIFHIVLTKFDSDVNYYF